MIDFNKRQLRWISTPGETKLEKYEPNDTSREGLSKTFTIFETLAYSILAKSRWFSFSALSSRFASENCRNPNDGTLPKGPDSKYLQKAAPRADNHWS